MRAIVDHTVIFLLDDNEGDVLPVGYAESCGVFARLHAVTVHLSDRGARVTASGIRCRKTGESDKRISGNIHHPVLLPDADEWIARARREVKA